MRLEARYFDGSNLQGQTVELSLSQSLVTARSLEGRGVLPAIPASSLFELYRAADGNRLDLGVTGNNDLRLMVEGPGVVAYIDRVLPLFGAQAAAQNRQVNVRLFAIAGMMLAVLTIGFLQLERLAPVFVPLESERALGERLMQGFSESSGAVCTSESGRAALARMVERLSSNLSLPIPLTVRVTKRDWVNAFALPGGQIVIFDGLIQKAQSPDEVAGVLAHEIGHVEHRHALRRLVRAAGVGFLASMVSGGVVSDLSQQLLFMTFSREMEAEADEAALRALALAQVSSDGFAAFFDRLAAEDTKSDSDSLFADSTLESLIATHPLSKERADKIRSQTVPPQVSPALNDAEWKALKGICKT